MKSIGTRIAAWYATAATATLACLFVAGYLLLERQLVHGLDLLIETEFREIDTRLGPDYRTLSPQAIETRIREITDYASTLFYIDMHVPGKGVIFRSTNLIGHDIADVPGERRYSVEVADIGEVRAEEFHKMPFEVTIATPLRPVRDVMDSYIKVCVLLLAAMVIASLVIGRALSRFVLWPVRLIRDTAKRIGSDNLSERIPVPDAHDEIADLARLLNDMFDRLEVSFHQVRRFTADASHELKIPLSLISLHAEKMLVRWQAAACPARGSAGAVGGDRATQPDHRRVAVPLQGRRARAQARLAAAESGASGASLRAGRLRSRRAPRPPLQPGPSGRRKGGFRSEVDAPGAAQFADQRDPCLAGRRIDLGALRAHRGALESERRGPGTRPDPGAAGTDVRALCPPESAGKGLSGKWPGTGNLPQHRYPARRAHLSRARRRGSRAARHDGDSDSVGNRLMRCPLKGNSGMRQDAFRLVSHCRATLSQEGCPCRTTSG